MPDVEDKFAALALDEPNYTFLPSGKGNTSSTELRTVTATYNGQRFDIEPTSWGTRFKHALDLQSGNDLDAYIEEAVKGKATKLPTTISMVHVKRSSTVPHGAKLVRVWGSDELWQLYFPPKPTSEGGQDGAEKKEKMKEKEAAAREEGLDEVNAGASGRKEVTPADKGKVRIERTVRAGEKSKREEQAKSDDSGVKEAQVQVKPEARDKDNSKAASDVRKQPDNPDINKDGQWKRPGKFAPDFAGFLKRVKENAGADEAFFDEYAVEVGSGVNGDDVRLDFANEVANPDLRRLYPKEGDAFWEQLWQLATREGTLAATAGRHWKDDHVTDPLAPSKVDIARASREKLVSFEKDFRNALSHAVMDTYEDSRLEACIRVQKAGVLSRSSSRMSDDEWHTMWSLFTRRGTLKGAPTREEWETMR